jgi:predicted dehydrogenase
VVWKEVPGVEVAAVADDDEAGLREALGRTGAAKGYRDYREMLVGERPDIAAVCPRWIDRHHEMLLACAASGCHVYMEKPFCRDLAEADEVVEAFERRGLKLAIAHLNRYRPEFAMAKRLLADGAIGEVMEFRGRGKEDARGGGEDLWVLGTHVLDLMLGLGGEAGSCYATVMADGRPVTRADVREGNEGIGPLAGDAIDATYHLKSGAAGYFASRRNQRGEPSRFGLRVFGSRGVIDFPSDGPVRVLPDPAWTAVQGGAGWVPVAEFAGQQPDPDRPQGNRAAVLDLIAAIGENRQPLSSLHDARAATELIAAVFESHRQRGPVAIPLANRENPLGML